MEHGFKPDLVRVRIDVDQPKPAAILFDARGEFLTGEAIRWCARYAIPLILPNGPGRAILFYESALEADGAGAGVNGKHAAVSSTSGLRSSARRRSPTRSRSRGRL